jgi:hypothetical protein
MRFWFLILLMLGLVACASCSDDARVKTESAVEQSVDKFHERLNQQQYHEIYLESDHALQSRITEPEFTAQLMDAHRQLGIVTSKARVGIDDGFWGRLKRPFRGGREKVTHGHIASGDEILANERFVWAVQNDQPTLVSYEVLSICRKPCQLRFGYDPP